MDRKSESQKQAKPNHRREGRLLVDRQEVRYEYLGTCS